MYLTAESEDFTYNNLGPFLAEHCTGMWVETFLNINALWHMFWINERNEEAWKNILYWDY